MIIVCSLKDHVKVCVDYNINYLISVIDPGFEPKTPNNVDYHLKLGFDDIEEIVNFIETWNQTKPIVIHCWCGVSRSMATATFLLCKMNTKNIEKNVRFIRSVAPHANPNKLMISMFEKNLNIEGKILNSLKKFPYTVNYDCDTNFAPISIFNLDI